jgi:ribosomal protein S18 acetylase RimI-like enzyme
LSELAFRAKAQWGYPEEWLRLWRGDLTLTPEYLAAYPGFVALDCGRPVGCCVAEVRGREASLEHLWIAPECQRRGIGRMLVGAALDIAAAAGVSRVAVIADPFAEPFYLRLGAFRTGEVPAPMPGAPDRVLPRLEFVVRAT